MLKLYDKGVYLLNGTEIVEEKEAVAAKTGKDVTPQEAAKNKSHAFHDLFVPEIYQHVQKENFR